MTTGLPGALSTYLQNSKLTIILIFFCNILHSTQTAHSLGGLSVLVVHATAATAAAATATDPELLHCLCRARFGFVLGACASFVTLLFLCDGLITGLEEMRGLISVPEHLDKVIHILTQSVDLGSRSAN
jgi:hypothetical protein